jgi:hypothetical protein
MMGRPRISILQLQSHVGVGDALMLLSAMTYSILQSLPKANPMAVFGLIYEQSRFQSI